MGRLDEVYRRSLEEPEAFWAEAAAAIDWDEPWERVLDDSSRAVLPLVHAAAGSTPATTRSTGTSTAAAATSSR